MGMRARGPRPRASLPKGWAACAAVALLVVSTARAARTLVQETLAKPTSPCTLTDGSSTSDEARKDLERNGFVAFDAVLQVSVNASGPNRDSCFCVPAYWDHVGKLTGGITSVLNQCLAAYPEFKTLAPWPGRSDSAACAPRTARQMEECQLHLICRYFQPVELTTLLVVAGAQMNSAKNAFRDSCKAIVDYFTGGTPRTPSMADPPPQPRFDEFLPNLLRNFTFLDASARVFDTYTGLYIDANLTNFDVCFCDTSQTNRPGMAGIWLFLNECLNRMPDTFSMLQPWPGRRDQSCPLDTARSDALVDLLSALCSSWNLESAALVLGQTVITKQSDPSYNYNSRCAQFFDVLKKGAANRYPALASDDPSKTSGDGRTGPPAWVAIAVGSTIAASAVVMGFILLWRAKRRSKASIKSKDCIDSAGSDNYSEVTYGQMTGSLDVQEEIGSGGQATIFKAVYNGEFIAVKAYSSMRAAVHEMQMISGIEHPNIIKTFGAKMHRGLYMICMELSLHGNLRDCMRLKKLRVDDRIAHQSLLDIYRALEYLKDVKGVPHRDVKPSNVLVMCECARCGNIESCTTCLASSSKKFTCKLSDFGMAKPNVFAHESSGNLAGTLLYMAPERMMAEQDAGDPDDSGKVNYFASDAYSAALIGWELCMYAKVGRYTSVHNHVGRDMKLSPLHITESREAMDMSKLGSEEAELLTSILTDQVARRPDTSEICQSLERMMCDKGAA